MRYTAVLLAAFMLLLSTTSGMLSVAVVNASAKKSQCPYAMGKMACKMAHHDQKKPCNKDGNCAMMLSCSVCGFFIAEPITVAQPLFHQITKPATPYTIGKLSDYNPSGWKPPKFNC